MKRSVSLDLEITLTLTLKLNLDLEITRNQRLNPNAEVESWTREFIENVPGECYDEYDEKQENDGSTDGCHDVQQT